MSITVKGTVQKSPMAAGTWALVGDDGQTYEIYQGAPTALLKEGQQVTVEGKVREDVMTIAMIGPVLEVKKFEAL
jgi:cytochrome c-type biogenesis protein CcmE